MSFVHLHRHSEYSRLDGVGTAKQYADEAARLQQPWLGQTDHGTLSGALHHIDACQKAGVIPVSGVEAYYRPDRKQAKVWKQQQAWHLCLFAKNLKGWHNLLKIVSVAYAEVENGGGFYQYPCVDDELLAEYHEGLVASSACFSSWIANLIYNGDSVGVTSYMDRMLSLFGDDFWIEIMPHDFDDQRTLNVELIRLAQERGIPIIATNDAHFPYKDWAETQRVAKMMGHNASFKSIKEEEEKGKKHDYLSDLTPTLYLAHEEEMHFWFEKFHPQIAQPIVDEAISNTIEFCRRLSPFMLDKTDKLPRVPLPEGQTSEGRLQEWIDEGLERIKREYPESHWEKYPWQDYLDRVDREYKILRSKGVIDYFIMVGDVVRWAKSQGIRVGLGRGSAAGCLVSYLVGIVAIDPIPWGLLFERFLNPSRKGLPDIDLDFQSDRRAEIKKYIADTYGQDHVADIITHQRFQPKSVLKDLCRTFDVDYTTAKKVTDTIDIRQDDEETTLEELVPINEDLAKFKVDEPEIWKHALRMEESVKNAGKHAAGIIITPKPIGEYMALERGKAGDLVTSWSDAAEFPVISDYGFVKLDALGIKGLQRHAYACNLIKEHYGVTVDLDKLGPLRDPYDVDDEVLEGFRQGWTIGIFQFGSRGITALLREIAPSGSALDLAAANALYRPGPMKGGVTWDYAKRKHGFQTVDYWHEIVKPILEKTYGLIAFQEQVMQISQVVGGFSGAEADDLRKAMGKLYRIKGGTAAKEFMAQYEQKWFSGAKAQGIERALADEIWHKILEFGHYGFNLSHSASYALQAYQDMWLKMKYPLAFYASILTLPSGSKPKEKEEFIQHAVREARSRDFEVEPPDINKSEEGWTIDPDKNTMRFSLEGINGCGPAAAKAIVAKRPEAGYSSVEEIVSACGARAVNKSRQDALREAGAFDCFGARDDATGRQIGKWERERLKITITVSDEMQKYVHLIKPNIYTQEEVEEAPKGAKVIVGGEITKIEKKKTSKGDPFANLTIVFEMNEWRVKLWKNALAKYEPLLEEGAAVMVNGSKDEWNGFISVVASQITSVEDLAEQLEMQPA
jgi:DNA polymerase-3 subunit alpha